MTAGDAKKPASAANDDIDNVGEKSTEDKLADARAAENGENAIENKKPETKSEGKSAETTEAEDNPTKETSTATEQKSDNNEQ